MHKITDSIKEFLDTNFKTENLNICDIDRDSPISLADSFYRNTDVNESVKITRKILEHKNLDPNIFIKGISRHLKNPLSPIYEHSIILTAALFKDSSFNMRRFGELDKFKDLMPVECFKSKQQAKIKSKFDSKKKIEIDKFIFVHRTPINYLQEGIKIIKEENRVRLDEVFHKLPLLINKASDRLIKAKYKEYFDTILSYDGYDLVKSDGLYALVIKSFDCIIDEVFNYIFSDDLCLRFKICLTDVLIKVVEKGTSDKIGKILILLSEKINEKEKKLNELILYNLKYLIELCIYKLI